MAEISKKIMVFGTFDIFHKGHESFLKQARKHGSHIIAVIARDKTVFSVKKKKPLSGERKRAKAVRDSGLADEVILGNLKDKYALIKKHKPDVICLGYDQEAFVGELKRKLREFGLDKNAVIRLKSYHPEKYKTSIIKKEV